VLMEEGLFGNLSIRLIPQGRKKWRRARATGEAVGVNAQKTVGKSSERRVSGLLNKAKNPAVPETGEEGSPHRGEPSAECFLKRFLEGRDPFQAKISRTTRDGSTPVSR
jgi:hypothetical protein